MSNFQMQTGGMLLVNIMWLFHYLNSWQGRMKEYSFLQFFHLLNFALTITIAFAMIFVDCSPQPHLISK